MYSMPTTGWWRDPFYGCVDPDAGYQVAGHSYGAFTALAIGGAVLDMSHLQATCEAGNGRLCEALDYWMLEHSDDLVIDLSDPRATSILSMTPGGWQVFGDGLANIDTPTCIMGAENDTVTTMEGDVLPVWERLVTTPRYLATLEQANHYSYTNLCEIAPFGDFCPEDGLDPELAFEAIRVPATAFLDVSNGESRSEDWLPSDNELMSWVVVD